MHLGVSAVSLATAIASTLIAGSAAAAPDRTQGAALMSAVVDDDGTLQNGAGAVSASRNGNGAYAVEFNRTVAGCTAIVTSVRSFANVSTDPNPNVLKIFTLPADGGPPADNNFKMLVFCAE